MYDAPSDLLKKIISEPNATERNELIKKLSEDNDILSILFPIYNDIKNPNGFMGLLELIKKTHNEILKKETLESNDELEKQFNQNLDIFRNSKKEPLESNDELEKQLNHNLDVFKDLLTLQKTNVHLELDLRKLLPRIVASGHKTFDLYFQSCLSLESTNTPNTEFIDNVLKSPESEKMLDAIYNHLFPEGRKDENSCKNAVRFITNQLNSPMKFQDMNFINKSASLGKVSVINFIKKVSDAINQLPDPDQKSQISEELSRLINSANDDEKVMKSIINSKNYESDEAKIDCIASLINAGMKTRNSSVYSLVLQKNDTPFIEELINKLSEQKRQETINQDQDQDQESINLSTSNFSRLLAGLCSMNSEKNENSDYIEDTILDQCDDEIYIKDENGYFPLFIAAKNKNFNLVKKIIDKHKKIIASKNNNLVRNTCMKIASDKIINENLINENDNNIYTEIRSISDENQIDDNQLNLLDRVSTDKKPNIGNDSNISQIIFNRGKSLNIKFDHKISKSKTVDKNKNKNVAEKELYTQFDVGNAFDEFKTILLSDEAGSKEQLSQLLEQEESWHEKIDSKTKHTIPTFLAAFGSNVNLFDELEKSFTKIEDEKKNTSDSSYLMNNKRNTDLGTPFETALKHINTPMVQYFLKKKSQLNKTIDVGKNSEGKDTALHLIIKYIEKGGHSSALDEFIGSVDKSKIVRLLLMENQNKLAPIDILENYKNTKDEYGKEKGIEQRKREADIVSKIFASLDGISGNNLNYLAVGNNYKLLNTMIDQESDELLDLICNLIVNSNNIRLQYAQVREEKILAEIAAEKGNIKLLRKITEKFHGIPAEKYENVLIEIVKHKEKFDGDDFEALFAINKDQEIIRWSSNDSIKQKVMRSAASSGNIAAVNKLLFGSSSDISQYVCDDGKTALYHCMSSNDPDVIKTIINKYGLDSIHNGYCPIIDAFNFNDLSLEIIDAIDNNDQIKQYIADHSAQAIEKALLNSNSELIEKVLDIAIENNSLHDALNQDNIFSFISLANEDVSRAFLNKVINRTFSLGEHSTQKILYQQFIKLNDQQQCNIFNVMNSLDGQSFRDFFMGFYDEHKNSVPFDSNLFKCILHSDFFLLEDVDKFINLYTKEKPIQSRRIADFLQSLIKDDITKYNNRYDIIEPVLSNINQDSFVSVAESLIEGNHYNEFKLLLQNRNNDFNKHASMEIKKYVLLSGSNEILKAYEEVSSVNSKLFPNFGDQENLQNSWVYAYKHNPKFSKTLLESKKQEIKNTNKYQTQLNFYNVLKYSIDKLDSKKDRDFILQIPKLMEIVTPETITELVKKNQEKQIQLKKHYNKKWDEAYEFSSEISKICDELDKKKVISDSDSKIVFESPQSEQIEKYLLQSPFIFCNKEVLINKIIKYGNDSLVYKMSSNINQQKSLDIEGNTFLHKVLQRKWDDEKLLKKCIDNCIDNGAFLSSKNKKGEKPHDDELTPSSLKYFFDKRFQDENKIENDLTQAYSKYQNTQNINNFANTISTQYKNSTPNQHYFLDSIVYDLLLKECLKILHSPESKTSSQKSLELLFKTVSNERENFSTSVTGENIMHKIFAEVSSNPINSEKMIVNLNSILRNLSNNDKTKSMIKSLLIQHDSEGKTPIELLAGINCKDAESFALCEDIIGGPQLLHDACDSQIIFNAAVAKGNTELIDYFRLKHNKVIDLQTITIDGKTPILEAVRNNNTNTLKKLINIGTSPDQYIDNNENTALHFILKDIINNGITNEKSNMIDALIRYGADLSIKNKQDVSPVDLMDQIADNSIKMLNRYDELLQKVKIKIASDRNKRAILKAIDTRKNDQKINISINKKILDCLTQEEQYELKVLNNSFQNILNEKNFHSKIKSSYSELITKKINFQKQIKKSSAQGIIKNFIESVKYSDFNFEVKGNSVFIKLNKNKEFKMSYPLSCHAANEMGVSKSVIDYGGGNIASVQHVNIDALGGEVKSYCVHQGSMTLTINGKGGKPSGLKIYIYADGTIGFPKNTENIIKKRKIEDLFSGATHIYIGSTTLIDAIRERSWGPTDIYANQNQSQQRLAVDDTDAHQQSLDNLNESNNSQEIAPSNVLEENNQESLSSDQNSVDETEFIENPINQNIKENNVFSKHVSSIEDAENSGAFESPATPPANDNEKKLQ